MTKQGINWCYFNDPNVLNRALGIGEPLNKTDAEAWEDLKSIDDIISITWDTHHGMYVAFFKCTYEI